MFSKKVSDEEHTNEIKKEAKGIEAEGNERSYFNIVNDLLNGQDE